jgi:hypothetical protein
MACAQKVLKECRDANKDKVAITWLIEGMLLVLLLMLFGRKPCCVLQTAKQSVTLSCDRTC